MPARSTLRAVLLLLAVGASTGGCGGGGGSSLPAADPAIVGVAPAEAWRGDPVTLTITGTDTGWSAASPPTVEAGADVTIDAVTVDSPTSLRVAARVAYDAVLGLRAIFVSVGSTFYATPAFEVKAPIGVSWLSQPFVRSSVVVGVIQTHRPGDIVDGAVVAVASDGELLPLYLDDPGAFILVIPEDAPLGPFDLLVHRTGTDGASMFRVAAGSIAPVLAFYVGPVLVVNAWLVGYTWLQHTDLDIPHYADDDWSWLKGAFQTVDRPYGPVIDLLHHRIGSTHVAHHIDHRIPHYRAREATDAIAAAFPEWYRHDPTPVPQALWRVAGDCLGVEERPDGWYYTAD